MYKIFSLAVVFAAFEMAAQITVSGVVKNEKGEVIPYCSIGVTDSDSGSVSDENGSYQLMLPEKPDAEIVFRAAGYSEKSVRKKDLEKSSDVVLEDHKNILETVVIKADAMKHRTIGQKKRPMLTFSKMFEENLPTVEQGNTFKIYEKTRLKAYNFYIIPSSKFREITMKLNIYRVRDGKPAELLLNENILHKTNTTGWQHIDLSTFDLTFQNIGEIAVTLQLVGYEKLADEKFVFGLSAKKSPEKRLLYRFQSQGIWEKNAGVFISNLEVAYSKTADEPEFDEE